MLAQRSIDQINEPVFNTCHVTSNTITSKSGKVYAIDSVLKKSLFGKVFKAFETSSNLKTNTAVAIKSYSKKMLASKKNSIENPLEEMKIMQHLTANTKSTNLMTVIECMESQDDYFLVLPFFSSGDIVDYINTHDAMSEVESKSCMLQILTGLRNMHKEGIAHRDLTSENVLCDYENHNFSIIDFGACHVLKREGGKLVEAVEALPVFGKKNYIAPEVFEQDSIFYPLKVDIWSIGVILFITLAGYPPMNTASPSDARYQFIISGQIQKLINNWNLSDKFSPQAVDLLNKIFVRDPVLRPTVDEIMAHPWFVASPSDINETTMEFVAEQA